jgi:hypothetical protein
MNARSYKSGLPRFSLLLLTASLSAYANAPSCEVASSSIKLESKVDPANRLADYVVGHVKVRMNCAPKIPEEVELYITYRLTGIGLDGVPKQLDTRVIDSVELDENGIGKTNPILNNYDPADGVHGQFEFKRLEAAQIIKVEIVRVI